jgi:hypothetical protein
VARTRPGTCFIILAAILLCNVPRVRAEDMRDLITNLWPGGILLEPPTSGFSHQPHFTASSLQGLDSLNSALASSIVTFSPSAAVGAFTFDVERGIPLPSSEPLGPLLAERARTIGKGRLNVAATYTRVRYTEFEGTSLDDLSLEFLHEDSNNDGKLGGGIFNFELETIQANLDTTIEQDVVGLFGTYGITEKWDVGVVVPLVRVYMDVKAHADVIHYTGPPPIPPLTTHQFGPNSSPQDVHSEDEATGIGDVLLRTKYNFLRDDPKLPDMAIAGWVRLPTGDEADLLGTGETSVAAIFVASKSFGRVAPHLNLGYEASTGDSSGNLVRYVVGFEASVHPKVTTAVDVLGLWKPEGNGIGDHIVDLALGIKWNPMRSFIVGGNVSLPLNKDEGLRADAIWTIGAEYTF